MDLALVVVMDLQQAERPLHDHDAGSRGRGLECYVGEPVDGEAGSRLDEEGGHAAHGQESAGGGADEARELVLHVVEEDVGAQGDLGHARTLSARPAAVKGLS